MVSPEGVGEGSGKDAPDDAPSVEHGKHVKCNCRRNVLFYCVRHDIEVWGEETLTECEFRKALLCACERTKRNKCAAYDEEHELEVPEMLHLEPRCS